MKILSYAMPICETNRPEAETHELTVEKWVYGGRGLGRLEGEVVLIPFVLPGERVRVRVERRRSGLGEAALAEVVAASQARVEPPCPYFGRCGGCQYQHASYEAQLEHKAAILRETLQRVGKLPAPEELRVVAAEPYGYRNRAQFHIQGGRIGFRQAGSNRLCPVEKCLICSPRINLALGELLAMAGDSKWPSFVRTLELFTNEVEVQVNILSTERPLARRFFEWCGERLAGADAAILEYAACGERFRVSRRSFFQVNRFLLERLVEEAMKDIAGEEAWDLYAGVGLFSVLLARRFAVVTAVESGAEAARDLKFNAQRASLPIRVLHAAVENFLAGCAHAPEFVLADPPRAGLGPAVVQHLVRLHPPVLAVVSCDPATLARDLAGLTAGGYRLESMTLVDLFPQTYHIETVARLKWSV
ncbi:MAG: class I SAM-dependent RNA methyltransferase [Bryobacteraceae bacterium]